MGRFQSVEVALAAISAARPVIFGVYKAMVEAEALHIADMTPSAKGTFRSVAQDEFSFDDQRSWGSHPYTSWMEVADFYPEGLGEDRIMFVKMRADLYRGEDWSIEHLNFPPALIDTYGTDDFAAHLALYMEKRVALVQEAFVEARMEREEREARSKAAAEERDRVEYARLQAKFGEQQ